MTAGLGITVVIPTIPPRADLLLRALDAVRWQTLPAADVIVEPDPDHTGSAATCNRGLTRVTTDWVLFAADDDQLMPHALQLLAEAEQRTGADVVSGPAWIPQIAGHQEPTDPLPAGPIAPEVVMERSRLTGTSLLRTSLVREVGGYEFRLDPGSRSEQDDYGLYYKLAVAGATFYRIPDYTFIWNVNGRNTSGRW